MDSQTKFVLHICVAIINGFLFLYKHINMNGRQDSRSSNSSVTSAVIFWTSNNKLNLICLVIQLTLYFGSHRWITFLLPLCLLILIDRRNYYLVASIMAIPFLVYSLPYLFPNTMLSLYLMRQRQNELIAKKIDFVLTKILAQHNHDVHVAKVLRKSVLQNENITEKQKLNALTKILIQNNVAKSFEVPANY